jgi:hypothetical protein
MNNIFEVQIGFKWNGNLKVGEEEFFIVNRESNEIVFQCRNESEADSIAQRWNEVGVTWRNDGTLELP